MCQHGMIHMCSDQPPLKICRRDIHCNQNYLWRPTHLMTFPLHTGYKCLHSTLPLRSRMSPEGTAHTYPACLALVLWHRCQQGIQRRICPHLPSRSMCQMDTSSNKKQHCWSFDKDGRHTVRRACCRASVYSRDIDRTGRLRLYLCFYQQDRKYIRWQIFRKQRGTHMLYML